MSDKDTCRRKKPCPECPFSRAVEPGTTGGTEPTVYVGQAHGPFWLPCHIDPAYKGKGDISNVKEVDQCAGAAIYRSNIGIAEKIAGIPGDFKLHVLPGDTTLVFATPAELLAHHTGDSIEACKEYLDRVTPEQLTYYEGLKAADKVIK